MSQQSPHRTNPAPVQKPSNEALQAAMDRHVAKSAQTVSKIPPQLRTILSKTEALNRGAGAVIHGKA